MTSQITILNKLSAADNTEKMDKWYASYIDNAMYKTEYNAINADRTNGASQAYTILIPFSDDFTKYSEWKTVPNGYTISIGDYIIFDKINETITAENIHKILQTHKGNYCRVESFTQAEKKYGVKYQLSIRGVS